MLVGQTHLQGCLKQVHTSRTCAQAWACHGTDGAVLRLVICFVMPMYCSKGCPQGEITIVGAGDVHGNPHRWRVRHKRMGRMSGRDENAGAYGLLAKIIAQDPLLDVFHKLVAEIADHCQIHACIHEPKRIARSDDAVKSRQVFKTTAEDFDLGVTPKLPP